jgi:urease subunit beta/urease subunit gamma/beta
LSTEREVPVIPGEWMLCEDPIEINSGKRSLRMAVRNTGDRAVQVGSHFHFFEVNRSLEFDRGETVGMRLDIPSGQSIRFEAGDERDVDLVEFGGSRQIVGFNNLVNGGVSSTRTVAEALVGAADRGFSGCHKRSAGSPGSPGSPGSAVLQGHPPAG